MWNVSAHRSRGHLAFVVVMGYVFVVVKKAAKKAEEVVRRKPDEKRREKFLRVRVTDEQHALIHQAAERAGIVLSAWVVERLLTVAKRELAG